MMDTSSFFKSSLKKCIWAYVAINISVPHIYGNEPQSKVKSLQNVQKSLCTRSLLRNPLIQTLLPNQHFLSRSPAYFNPSHMVHSTQRFWGISFITILLFHQLPT